MSLFRGIKEMAKKGGDFWQSVKETQSLNQDIAHVKDWKLMIERLLSFNGGGQFQETLRETFKVWLNFQDLRPKFERADAVFSAFVMKDKIFDSLNRSLSFAEEIDSGDDIKTTPKHFMNQCIYFLQKNVNSMKEEYSEWTDPEKLQPVPKNVLRFIREECMSIPTLKDIPTSYEILQRLEATLKDGVKKTPQQEKDIAKVSACMELLSHSHSDIDGLDVIRERLSQKIESMDKTIHDGNELYLVISNSMTDEWFASFDPDKTGISSCEELKEFYLRQLRPVLGKVKDFAD